MVPLAAALLAVGEPAWEFAGTTNSGLRVFVDRASVGDGGGLRHVGVRLGAARPIARGIVRVIETVEIDCAGDRWRLLDFTAYDAADTVVASRTPPAPPMPLTPIADASLGATLRDAVCGANTGP